MSQKYYSPTAREISEEIYQISSDIRYVVASKVYNRASWQADGFKGSGALQQAGTSTTNVSFPEYIYKGNPISGVKVGWMPTLTLDTSNFWYSTTPGTYSLAWSDSGITIDGVTWTNYDFRDLVIPREIFIVAVGAGGGSGGNGCWRVDKDHDWIIASGGAGGGGGIVIGRIDLTATPKLNLVVGQGGAKGTSGVTTKASTGAAGTAGGTSRVEIVEGTMGPYASILYATGGQGGTGGTGDTGEVTRGSGGNGGSYKTGGKDSVGCNGGGGNSYGSHTNTACAGLTCSPTPGTGAPQVIVAEARDNNGNTGGEIVTAKNSDDAAGNGASAYFSGGSSLGWGAFPYVSDSDQKVYVAQGTGGGGIAGIFSDSPFAAGANGYIGLYY